MTDSQPFDHLVAALEGGDFLSLADAARLLGELGDPRAVGPLSECIRRSRHYTKNTACLALGAIGDASAAGALQAVTDEPGVYDDWFWIDRKAVRAAAALALLQLGDESRVAVLEELAEAGNDIVFCFYAPAILRLPDDLPAVRNLKARITPEALGNLETPQRRTVEPGRVVFRAEALGVLATPDACAVLRDWLAHPSRYVRGAAAVALLAADASGENVAAVEALADADVTDFVHVKAHLALACAGRSDCVAPIANAAATLDDAFDRAVAVEALGLAPDGAAHADTIAAQLDHADEYVRLCAIEALDRIAAAGAGELARKHLEDPSPRVALQAARLLVALEGKEAN